MHLFNQHRQLYAYMIGEQKGQWGVVDDNPLRPAWPFVYLWIAAAPKSGKPDKYYFRFDLTGYSHSISACPWDPNTNQRLSNEHWPSGGPMVAHVFNTAWQGGNALYAPCDRGADLPGHANWAGQYPKYYWQPHFTFIKYLDFLYEILNSGDYQYS